MAHWIDEQMDRMEQQPLGKGPAKGPWTADQEQQFRTTMAFSPAVRDWRNKFMLKYDESPNMNDPNFDYREAFINNNLPQPVEGDTVPHWGSRGKSSEHPTEWMNTFMQQFGVDPTKVPDGDWTPEMQAFMKSILQEK